MILPFFTIGHSNRSLDAFVDMLREASVGLLVDIRTVPRSRSNPQFNKDTLPASLQAQGIRYEHAADLGGLRGKSKTIAPCVNGFWDNASFHNYADYAMSAQFDRALDHLVAQGRATRTVVMCSESVWWRCHRRIVADHLIARGEKVFHIMGVDRLSQATLTPGAVVGEDATVVYPEKTSAQSSGQGECGDSAAEAQR